MADNLDQERNWDEMGDLFTPEQEKPTTERSWTDPDSRNWPKPENVRRWLEANRRQKCNEHPNCMVRMRLSDNYNQGDFHDPAPDWLIEHWNLTKPSDIPVDGMDTSANYYAEDRDEDVVPAVLWDIAERVAGVYYSEAPLIYPFIRKIRIIGCQARNHHITVLAPGWSSLLDEDETTRTPKNLAFGREFDAANKALRKLASQFGFGEDDEPGRWLANKKGCRVIFNMAGGRGFSVSHEVYIQQD